MIFFLATRCQYDQIKQDEMGITHGTHVREMHGALGGKAWCKETTWKTQIQVGSMIRGCELVFIFLRIYAIGILM